MAEVFNNLVRSTLASGISAVATSLTVQSGDGNALFPAPTGGDFGRLAVYKKATGDIEHMTYDARTADVLTIIRATEGIGNSAAVAIAFDAGDLVELRPTAAFLSSLNVTSTDVQSGQFLYSGTDTGTADAYVFAFSPVVVSYVAGMEIRAKVANSCTGGACTIDFGPGVKTVVMEDGSTPPAGAIRALYTHTFRYDGTNVVLQSTGLALTASAGFNALGKQIKNVAAGTAATDAATIGGTEVHTNKTYTSPTINGGTIDGADLDNCTVNGGAITSGTAESLNTKSTVSWTGLPSWTKKLTLLFTDVDITSSIAGFFVAIGDSGGIETTNYFYSVFDFLAPSSPSFAATLGTEDGVRLSTITATDSWNGRIDVFHLSGNEWQYEFKVSSTANTLRIRTGTGRKTLSGTLDRVRLELSASTWNSGIATLHYTG